ncbi:MAG: hypothetical protein ACRDMU_04665, partial [Gaiellaceae bacterium]
TGAGVELRPQVLTIPSDPEEAGAAFPWIEFEGRWGELQRAFFNGPSGPNLKTQWTEPIRWSEGWRDRSYAVPGGGAFGTGATDFFCDAVAGGSRALQRLLDEPWVVFFVLAALAALVLLVISRATWRPTAPLHLARRRAGGQILAASARMYGGRLPLFVGIGVLAIPVSLLVTLLQAAVLQASRVVGIETEGESSGLLVLFVVAIGTTLTLLGLGFVQAATVRALIALDDGRAVGPVRAYRLAFDSVLPLLGALAVAVLVVTLLASSVLLLPIAIWLTVSWALIVPAVEVEELSAAGALRRSRGLVRPAWLKVGSLVLVGGGLVLAAAPLIGGLLILATSAPLWLLNVVAGVVYALTMPFFALVTAYLYFDARAWEALAPDPEPAELPPEIGLAG